MVGEDQTVCKELILTQVISGSFQICYRVNTDLSLATSSKQERWKEDNFIWLNALSKVQMRSNDEKGGQVI